MTVGLPDDSGATEALLERVRAGDRSALDELLARHRDLLRRFIEQRLDPRLAARLDASDVIQEAQLEVARRIEDYLQRLPLPFDLWLRKTAYENLLRLRRRHLTAECRSVQREVPLPDHSSILLAERLLADSAFGPAQRVATEEAAQRVRAAVAGLDEIDREILLLRTFDGLDNQAVAQVLDLEPGTASKRYGRALLRLRKLLTGNDPQPAP